MTAETIDRVGTEPSGWPSFDRWIELGAVRGTLLGPVFGAIWPVLAWPDPDRFIVGAGAVAGIFVGGAFGVLAAMLVSAVGAVPAVRTLHPTVAAIAVLLLAAGAVNGAERRFELTGAPFSSALVVGILSLCVVPVRRQPPDS